MTTITLPSRQKQSFEKISDVERKAWFGVGVDLEIDFEAYHSRMWVNYKGSKYYLMFSDEKPLINEIFLRPFLYNEIAFHTEKIDLIDEGFEFKKLQAFASGYFHLVTLGAEKYEEVRGAVEKGEYPITWN